LITPCALLSIYLSPSLTRANNTHTLALTVQVLDGAQAVAAQAQAVGAVAQAIVPDVEGALAHKGLLRACRGFPPSRC